MTSDAVKILNNIMLKGYKYKWYGRISIWFRIKRTRIKLDIQAWLYYHTSYDPYGDKVKCNTRGYCRFNNYNPEPWQIGKYVDCGLSGDSTKQKRHEQRTSLEEK